MKKAIILLLFSCFSATAQKTKLLIAEKVHFDEVNVNKNNKVDEEIKDNMTTFLGFGFDLSVKGVEEKVQEENKTKQKSAVRFQVGFQMPKFIKTKPPQKVFKLGWDVGILK
jgi:hypothetical protein